MGRKAAGQGLAEVKAFWEKNPGERTAQAGAQMAGIAYQTFLNYTKKLVKQGVLVRRKDATKKGKPTLYRLKGADEAATEKSEAEKVTPSVLTVEKTPEDFTTVPGAVDTTPTMGS